MLSDVSETRSLPDPRPPALRALLWVGRAILVVLGLPLVAVGLLDIGDPTGQALLCLGLVLLVSAAGSAAREVAERRHLRHPPEPRLVTLEGGERALFLPRDPAPSRIASLALLGYAVIALVGVVVTAAAGIPGAAVALALLAAAMLYFAAPHRGSLAGGVWFTPERMVHEHEGVRWSVPWDDVTGVVPQQPMPVLVRPERMPVLERTGPRGRAWSPRAGEGVLTVDTRHLAGGATLASYIMGKSVTDPASRAVLGTPPSIPPFSP